jgi:5-methylcytosine-specific restriction endonuclease McrA
VIKFVLEYLFDREDVMGPRPEPPSHLRPEFGAVRIRRYGVYAVYFEGQLQGYCRYGVDAYEWLDEQIVERYGAGDPRRYLPRRSLQRVAAAATHHNWRAARMGLPGVIAVEDWIALICHFGGVCLRCGSTRIPVLDHVIPLSAGGPNLIVNVQPLCLSCNSHKSNNWTDYRDPATFERFLPINTKNEQTKLRIDNRGFHGV